MPSFNASFLNPKLRSSQENGIDILEDELSEIQQNYSSYQEQISSLTKTNALLVSENNLYLEQNNDLLKTNIKNNYIFQNIIFVLIFVICLLSYLLYKKDKHKK